MPLAHNPVVLAEIERMGGSFYHDGGRVADRLGVPAYVHSTADHTLEQLQERVGLAERHVERALAALARPVPFGFHPGICRQHQQDSAADAAAALERVRADLAERMRDAAEQSRRAA